MDTVGRNNEVTKSYMVNQRQEDIVYDPISMRARISP